MGRLGRDARAQQSGPQWSLAGRLRDRPGPLRNRESQGSSPPATVPYMKANRKTRRWICSGPRALHNVGKRPARAY